MAKQASLYLPKAANNGSAQLTSSDTTSKVTVFTAGSDDSDLKSLIAAHNDTAIINLQLYVNRSSTDYLIGTVSIPALAGSSGSLPNADLLAAAAMPGLPVDSMGKPYLPLKNGDVLKVACIATMSGSKTLHVSAFGQDY
jgi:hypothetical protein